MAFIKAPALAPQDVESPGISAMLVALLLEFQRQDISYCYWKSGRRVMGALSGKSDLDLLIARSDRQRAFAILVSQGFKNFPDVHGRDHPAIMSFLGYDEMAGEIRHLHVHFRLVLGNAMLKRYRLPCENSFIARSVRHPSLPIRVLDPVDEALLLMVRTHLELRRLEPVAIRQWAAIQQKYRMDFADLIPRVNRRDLCNRAAEIFSAELADEIANDFAAMKAPRSLRRIRNRISEELLPYQTCNSLEGFTRTLGRTLIWAAGQFNRRVLHLPRPWGRRAPGGGAVISFVGVDGSGKSTLLLMSQKWLEAEIDVLTFYFGTGDGRPGLILLPFKLMARLIAPFIKLKPRGASHGKISDRPPGFAYSVLFGPWAVAVALEKRQKLIAARRAANRGMIAVTDRYPQNEIAGYNDGPLLPRLTYLPGWLRRFESSIYALAHRTPPDLVIKLRAGPETVARREPDMSPVLAAQRIAWLDELIFPGARIVSVDTQKPLEEVIAIVKREIWSIL